PRAVQGGPGVRLGDGAGRTGPEAGRGPGGGIGALAGGPRRGPRTAWAARRPASRRTRALPRRAAHPPAGPALGGRGVGRGRGWVQTVRRVVPRAGNAVLAGGDAPRTRRMAHRGGTWGGG